MPTGFRKNGTKLGFQKGDKNPMKRLEVRKKMSKSRLGIAPWNKEKIGQVFTEEHRKNISKNHHDVSLNKNPNWKDGKSFELYSENWTDDLKESIRKRDNYICQICGIHQDELEYKLHCHHIDYNKKNLDPNNLISLCRDCHLKTNHNREHWIIYFKNYVKKNNLS